MREIKSEDNTAVRVGMCWFGAQILIRFNPYSSLTRSRFLGYGLFESRHRGVEKDSERIISEDRHSKHVQDAYNQD